MRPSSLLFLPLTLAALVGAPSSAQEPASEPPAASITDEDYRFRLDLPGEGWKLQELEEIRQIQPKAVAGLLHPPSAYGAIIVEPMPDADLQAIARLVAERYPLEEKELESFETLEFQGRSAVRLRITGAMDEVPYRYEIVIFENRGFVYQIVAWCRTAHALPDGSNLQPIFDAFTLLEGEVRKRVEVVVPRDACGPGWRLREGVYQNAALGVEIRPRGAWRVRAGKELGAKGGDSLVELTCADPVANVAFLADRITGLDPAAYEKDFFDDRREEFLSIAGTVEGELGGAALALHRYTAREREDGSSPNMRHLCGARLRGEQFVQVYAWFPISLEEAGEKAVLEALDMVRFLEEEERLRLAAELASEVEPPEVGSTWAIRRGTYRDYRNGFQWTRPSPLWQIRTGAAAQRFSANTLIALREPTLGVWGSISAMPAVEADPQEYHRVVAQNMFGPEAATTNALELDYGGIHACASTAEPVDDGGHARYLLVTALGKERRFHMNFWGPPALVEAAADELAAAVRGFELLPEESSPSSVEEDVFRDERFGFELARPGPEWSFVQLRRDLAGSASSNAGWQSGSDKAVFLAAIHGVPLDGTGTTLEWISKAQELPPEVRERFDGEPVSSESTVHGLPARHVRWTGEEGAFDLFVFTREGTLYSLGMASAHGEPSVEKVLSGLRFLP